MSYFSNDPKTSAINIRCNNAERAMIESLCANIKPKVSASRMILFLCEEKAHELGLIKDEKNGVWSIDE